MHDVLAHKVSLIALHAGALEVNADAEPEQVERTAALIRTTAREAMEDLREVLGVLRAGGGAGRADLAPARRGRRHRPARRGVPRRRACGSSS